MTISLNFCPPFPRTTTSILAPSRSAQAFTDLSVTSNITPPTRQEIQEKLGAEESKAKLFKGLAFFSGALTLAMVVAGCFVPPLWLGALLGSLGLLVFGLEMERAQTKVKQLQTSL